MTSPPAMRGETTPGSRDDQPQFLEVEIGGQAFGIPVLLIREVLGPRKPSLMPLAPPSVGGILNLRGRIVTAIDSRARLGLPSAPIDQAAGNVIVTHGGELYSLTVDAVGAVLTGERTQLEPNPPTHDPRWREVADGVYRLDGRLMILLDVDRFLAAASSGEPHRRAAA